VVDVPDIAAIADLARIAQADKTHPRHGHADPVYARGAEVSQTKRQGRIPLDPLTLPI
jgi:hypothetical protein